MSSSISKFRIFCITENTWVYVYKPTNSPPTVCPNNNNHIVNADSVSIEETVSNNVVSIATDTSGNTSGIFRHQMKKLTCLPNAVTKQNTSFNYPISVLAFQYNVAEENKGDMFGLYVKLPMFLGAFNYSVDIGTTVLTLPIGFLNYLALGYLLELTNTVSGFVEETGEIIGINKVDNTVTLFTPIQNNFPVGTAYKFVIPKFVNVYMNVVSVNSAVGNYLRASTQPKGIIAEMRYTNNSNVSKEFVYGVDLMF